MSLYDDLVFEGDDKNADKEGWSKSSGIRLLHEHLQNKKAIQNQNKREVFRKTTPLSLSTVGHNKTKAITEELCPPAITAINISYVGKESKGSLLGGDWDVAEEYDPFWPNDYEKIMKERKEKRDRQKESDRNRQLEERDRKRKDRFERTVVANRSLGLDYDDDEEEEDNESDDKNSDRESDKERDRSRAAGAMIAPPPSLLESSDNQTNSNFGVSSVAAKIMARMGYKEGQGLGREEQGISTALSVEKTSKRGGKIIHEKETPVSSAPLMPPPPPLPTITTQPSAGVTTTSSSGQISNEVTTESITEIMKNPSKVVLLRNMVGPGEVDELLEPETKEECGKYGEVIKCIIFELTGPISDEEAVRIFIEFKRVESAIKAVVDLNGRYFGGRVVKANFYDIEKFKRLELKE